MNKLTEDIKILLNLAWPVVISRVGILTLGITDTVMVGRYASEHLAYLGIGMVPSNIYILIMIGLLMGTSVLVSNRFGAGQYDKTGEVLWHALPWGFAIGLIGFLFCYFGEFWLLLTGRSRAAKTHRNSKTGTQSDRWQSPRVARATIPRRFCHIAPHQSGSKPKPMCPSTGQS